MIVVIRVRLRAGVPDDFLAEDRLAVDHRGDLAVTGARVEADATPIQVAAQRLAHLGGRRHLVGIRNLDDELLLIDLPAHEVVVESALALRCIDLGDMLADLPWTADDHLVAAALPQQELDDPLDIGDVLRSARRAGREDLGVVAGARAVSALQGDRQGNALTGGLHTLPE